MIGQLSYYFTQLNVYLVDVFYDAKLIQLSLKVKRWEQGISSKICCAGRKNPPVFNALSSK